MKHCRLLLFVSAGYITSMQLFREQYKVIYEIIIVLYNNANFMFLSKNVVLLLTARHNNRWNWPSSSPNDSWQWCIPISSWLW